MTNQTQVENLYNVSKVFTSNLTDNRPLKVVFHNIKDEVLNYSLEIAGILVPLETAISSPSIPENFSIEVAIEEYRKNYIQKHEPKNEADFLELEAACHFEREYIEMAIEKVDSMTLEERIMNTTFKLMMIGREIRLSEVYGCMKYQVGEDATNFDFCTCGGIYLPVWDNAPEVASFCSSSGVDCPDQRNRCKTD